MLQTLSHADLALVVGGCGDETCSAATLNFLQICTLPEMFAINAVFKEILLSEEMLLANAETKKAALIAAVEKMSL